jgi:copper chaperone
MYGASHAGKVKRKNGCDPLDLASLGTPIYWEAEKPLSAEMENLTMKLNVPDMSCGHCAGVITKAIRAVDPTADVKVDLPSKTVEVTTAAQVPSISKALLDAGYSNTAA